MLWKLFSFCLCFLVGGPCYASDLDYRFAADAMEEVKEAEEVILALPTELRNAAFLSIGGMLNLQMQAWGKETVAKRELSPAELFAAIATALRTFAALTQRADWTEATVCHLREASALDDMAAGKPAKPVNCRDAVYGRIQVNAMRLGPKLSAPGVAEPLQQWVTSTILMSFYTVRAGRDGLRK